MSQIKSQTVSSFKTLLYYKFVKIENPESFLEIHKLMCEKLNLKGRILISDEGINGTIEGSISETLAYMDSMHSDPRFEDMLFKQAYSNGKTFPKLQIRNREEIVTTGLDYHRELGPLTGLTGKYLSSEELNTFIKSGKEFYIIDMRNDYEFKVGHFENSILPKAFKNFRDLPAVLQEIEHLKDKTVVTVCTGGVRCEKASGFLMYHGFTNVYQLKDGIVTYMEKYPNQDFLGKLYVFDKRLCIGFNTDSKDHQIVGKCDICGAKSENLVDYIYQGSKRIHGIVCDKCLQLDELILD
jgi:UPF0176 protein